MRVEITFHTSSTPKCFLDAIAVYTKGGFVCVESTGWIYNYPLCNEFSVVHKHQSHSGSSKQTAETEEDE